MRYSTAVVGSESVEVLVNKEYDMAHSPVQKDESDSTCLGMFDCLSAKDTLVERRESYAHKRASRRIGKEPAKYLESELTEIGVERQMRVQYNQPHLIEPMKLTVFDALPPPTPVFAQQPSHVARFTHQARKSISRASTRASLATGRRRALSKVSISKPQATLGVDDCQLRRNPSFRPLQLSIYADKRLSDLPEFDAVSFTEEGEIRLPPKALVRAQSEELLRQRSPTMPSVGIGKTASMFEQSLSRRVSTFHTRNNTSSTVLSTSRPSSAYDALHSHPVSWYSLPGLPPTLQFATAPDQRRKMLSPMKEEFTPPPSGAVIINGKLLAFPEVQADRVSSEMAHSSLLPPGHGQENESSAPSPIIDPGPTRRTMVISKHKAKISESASILLASSAASTRTRAATIGEAEAPVPAVTSSEDPKTYFHTDFKTNKAINQWLADEKPESRSRSRDSSISTIKSNTTSSSFAEHRRKRSQFYQLNHAKACTATTAEEARPGSAKAMKTPTPLSLYHPFPPKKAVTSASTKPLNDLSKSNASLKSHTRTQTASTVASTVATDVLFERPETPELEHEGQDQFTSAQALPHTSATRRAYDAESMTTVDMKSRTGTMKSTATSSSSHRQDSPVPLYLEKELNPGSEIIAVTKGQSEFIFRGNTPTPDLNSPKTPLSAQTADVEKMMFEMCAQGGYRRVNVGVAF